MNDELLVVAVILGGMAVMVMGIVLSQRGKEARLAAQRDIEISIESGLRWAAVLLPGAIIGPVFAGLYLSSIAPWPRQHPLGAMALTLVSSLLGLFIAIKSSRTFRRVGALRYTPARLELEVDGTLSSIDLSAPFEMIEASSLGPTDMQLQVLVFTQHDKEWGFSYGLPISRKPQGDQHLPRPIGPLLGGEAKVIHDRLVALKLARS
ncbi:MAG: hypothetical protein Q8N23_16925 [Archangium sp.]|nr:hypothetical protein [Archangium sp.]MDP3154362.1 hypothetical protein [Archangium sp.]MDP3573033.1 hypothetical protein [Archangium sp.]